MRELSDAPGTGNSKFPAPLIFILMLCKLRAAPHHRTMKRLLCANVLLLVATGFAGPDLTPFQEGDSTLRERLKVVDAANPPPLQVSNWINSEPSTLASLKGKIVVL